MSKATIRKISDRTVALTFDDEFTGERRTREFWVTRSAGRKYVREGDKQVCDGLSHFGNTLQVNDADELLTLIRKQWKAIQAADRRAATAR
jgi:hypothetical protein